MKMNLVRVSCAGALMLAFAAWPDDGRAQSQGDAEQFVSNNIMDHSFVYDGEEGVHKYSVKFDACQMSVLHNPGIRTNIYVFDVRDVSFVGELYRQDRDYKDYSVVRIRCISGRCVKKQSGGGEPEPESIIYLLDGMHERVANALKHLQTLCGGARNSAF